MKKSKSATSRLPVAQLSLESLAAVAGGEAEVATATTTKSMHDMQMTPIRALRG